MYVDLGKLMAADGLKANGADDCTEVFEQALDIAYRDPSLSTVLVPEGVGGVGRGPIPGVRLTRTIDMPPRTGIAGMSTSSGSVIVVDHEHAGIRVAQGGCFINRLQLKASDDHVPAAALHLEADDVDGDRGSFFESRSLMINDGPWGKGVWLDGSRRTVNPKGLRGITFYDTRTWDTNEGSLIAENTVSLSLVSWRAHKGRGANCDLEFSGSWTLDAWCSTNGDVLVRDCVTASFPSVRARKLRRWEQTNTRCTYGSVNCAAVIEELGR